MHSAGDVIQDAADYRFVPDSARSAIKAALACAGISGWWVKESASRCCAPVFAFRELAGIQPSATGVMLARASVQRSE
jgi:hypothetical protein